MLPPAEAGIKNGLSGQPALAGLSCLARRFIVGRDHRHRLAAIPGANHSFIRFGFVDGTHA
jgi:hypothetical protein